MPFGILSIRVWLAGLRSPGRTALLRSLSWRLSGAASLPLTFFISSRELRVLKTGVTLAKSVAQRSQAGRTPSAFCSWLCSLRLQPCVPIFSYQRRMIRPWGDTQRLEGRGAPMGPQPVAQSRAGDTAAQPKSCRDELGAPEVAGANKEASVKRPRGSQGCSSMQVTRPPG